MNIRTFLAHVGAAFRGEMAPILGELKRDALADYDEAINQAHVVLEQAQAQIGDLAHSELKRIEALMEAAERRANQLLDHGVLPPEHGGRLDAIVGKFN